MACSGPRARQEPERPSTHIAAGGIMVTHNSPHGAHPSTPWTGFAGAASNLAHQPIAVAGQTVPTPDHVPAVGLGVRLRL